MDAHHESSCWSEVLWVEQKQKIIESARNTELQSELKKSLKERNLIKRNVPI